MQGEVLEERHLLTAAPMMLADIFWTGTSDPQEFVDVNGTVFFSAYTPESGRELYKSDGTSAGTRMVKNTNTSPYASSYLTGLTNVNGTLFFTASESSARGIELWKSDGTEAGTVMVKEISTVGGSYPFALTNVNGTLYFSASDFDNGQELWVSDGTESGTVMVADINPSGYSGATEFTEVNGTVYFRATDGVSGFELWKTNGTTAGTVRVKDIYPGAGSSYPSQLTKLGGRLYFVASDGNHGEQLWTSDGTEAGTVMVKKIAMVNSYGSISELTNLNGVLIFALGDQQHGTELWKSDGSAAGTSLLKDIVAGPASSNPNQFVEMNGRLYFSARNALSQRTLWSTDGTANGTEMVANISPGFDANPGELVNVGGTLYFSAYSPVSGVELWKSDGTLEGTVSVADLSPGTPSSNPRWLRNAQGTLYFSANNGFSGDEPWIIAPQPSSLSGKVYYDQGNDGVFGDGDMPAAGAMVFDDLNNNSIHDNFSQATFSSTDVPKAIPDLSNVSSTLRISDLNGLITDIDVHLTLHHSYVGDLRITLIGPNANTVTLSNYNGGSGDHYINTTFDESAVTPIASGTAPFTGTFWPEASLEWFHGMSPNGIWRLQVIDSTGSDVGTLDSWSLTITTSAAEPNAITAADGSYQFPVTGSGTHHIRQSFASDVASSVPLGGVYDLNLTEAQDVPNLNFGNRRASVSGNVFADWNANTVRNGSEPGLAGWMIYNDLNGNSFWDSTTTTTIPSLNVPLPVPAASQVTSDLNVSGLSGVITDVNVTLTIHHTWDDDLTVVLIAPDGTEVLLTSQMGGSADNYLNTTFDDSAATGIAAGAAPFTGTFAPLGSLAALIGKNPNGVWRLRAVDAIPDDTGTLDEWKLEIRTDGAEPTTRSDTTGNYTLSNLNQGENRIAQLVQPGFSPTWPAVAHVISLAAPAAVLGARDFGNRDTLVTGTVYSDLNQNGARNGGEPGLVGWTVYDDLNNNGALDPTSQVSLSDLIPRAIPDRGTHTSSVQALNLNGTITDVNVNLTLHHSYVSDLVITLIAPDGTRVPLVANIGEAGQNFLNTTFDDSAATAIASASAPFSGTFRPTSLLSALNGKAPNGVWRLEVKDTLPGDSGILDGWTLQLRTNGAEPSTLSGAGGAYALRMLDQRSHSLRQVPQPGYTPTAPVGGLHAVVPLVSQLEFSAYDFGNFAATSGVLKRQIFYNNSKFDGNGTNGGGASTSDDLAIATDKSAYLGNGGQSTFANMTSYNKGINGIMVDLAGSHPGMTAADFVFRAGANNSPSTWAAAPAPAVVSVRAGAGTNGSDRVEIIWADGVLKNVWLEVTVKNNANTGLASVDVFYFGNRIGNVPGTVGGDTTSFANVASNDQLETRGHIGIGAIRSNLYDFDRNKVVDANDELIARGNIGSLRYIVVAAPLAPEEGGSPSAAPAAVGGDASATTETNDEPMSEAGIAVGLANPPRTASAEGSIPQWLATRFSEIALHAGVVASGIQLSTSAGSITQFFESDPPAEWLTLEDHLLDEMLADW